MQQTNESNQSEQLATAMIARLRAICQGRGIGVSKLAEITHLSKSTVSDLWNDKSQPNLMTLLNICTSLGISLSDLCEPAVDAQKHDLYCRLRDDEAYLLVIYRKLSKRGKERLRKTAHILDVNESNMEEKHKVRKNEL